MIDSFSRHKEKVVKLKSQLEDLKLQGKEEEAKSLEISLKDLEKQVWLWRLF